VLLSNITISDYIKIFTVITRRRSMNGNGPEPEMDCIDGCLPYEKFHNNNNINGMARPNHIELETTTADRIKNTTSMHVNGLNCISTSSQTTQSPDEVPEEIFEIAKSLADDLVHYVANNNSSKNLKSPSSYSRTMRRTVDELLEKHDILFKGMVAKLNVTGDNVQVTFVNVADEIFQDRQFNWGRIVAVYAFAGRLARHCVEKDLPDRIDQISEFLGSYVGNRLGVWIHQHGGWTVFNDYFPEKNGFENKIWKGLLVTAMGLGALATMVAAR